MQSNEDSVKSNCLLIVIPRLMLSQTSVLHQRKERTRLHPSNKNPFLWSLSSFISSYVESEIEIISRGADNNVYHCLLESENSIVLRTHPPREHHIFRGETPMQCVLEALNWTRHYQSVGVFRFSVVIKGAVVLISIIPVSNVSL